MSYVSRQLPGARRLSECETGNVASDASNVIVAVSLTPAAPSICGRCDVEFNGVEDDFRGWLMDREGDGFLSGKACGGQVRFQSQIVANRDHMSWKPIWIECAWRRVLIHILTFRSFRWRLARRNC